MPLLDYGFKVNVIRIYTAKDFIDEMSSPDTEGKTYVVMNDIDFNGTHSEQLRNITNTFRGNLSGRLVNYEVDGDTYQRRPILFNIDLGSTVTSDNNFGIFKSISNASISDLNIVIKESNVVFDLGSSNNNSTSVGILAGVATNSSISNVHVYSSLISKVDNNYKTYSVSNTVDVSGMTVSHGYKSESGVVKALSDNQYLVLAERNLDTGKVSTHTLLYNGVDNKFNSSGSISDVAVTNGFLTSNADMIGGLVGSSNGTAIRINNSSSNIDITLSLTKRDNNRAGYVAGIGGYVYGEFNRIVSNSNITVASDVSLTSTQSDIDELYVGGMFGKVQGALSDLLVQNATVKVGKAENRVDGSTLGNIKTRSSSIGLFVGGAVASLTTEAQSLDSENSFSGVTTKDVKVDVYSIGKTFVGGVLADNNYNIKGLNAISTSKDKSGISLHVTDANSSSPSDYIVGGVIARNNASKLTTLYSNVNILVTASCYGEVMIGGIVGRSFAEETTISGAICDAFSIKQETPDDANGFHNLFALYMGGIIGRASSLSETLILKMEYCASFADIYSSQQAKMYLGGLVGSVGKLYTYNCITLGDIIMARGLGEDRDSFFYQGSSELANNEYYVGGMAGQCINSFAESSNSQGTLVVTSIKDYAIAQKLEVNYGPVIGSSSGVTSSNDKKVVYCENLSLVMDNGFASEHFDAVSQIDTKTKFNALLEEFNKSTDSVTFDNDGIKPDKTSTYDSNYLSKYSPNTQGSKLNPIVWNSDTTNFVVESNKYYMLTGNICINDVAGSGISSGSATNFFVNGQGYGLVAKNVSGVYVPAFDNISENSAVSSLINVCQPHEANAKNINVVANFGSIASYNYGFIYAISVSGSIRATSGSGVAENVTSIVGSNYGVMSSSFSIADIVTSGGASGMINQNGDEDERLVGNIYASYYSGLINYTATEGSSSISGFVGDNKYGVLSNCYTDANISAESGTLYPIVNVTSSGSSNSGNLYRTYYDYVAYHANPNTDGGETEDMYEGKSVKSVFSISQAERSNTDFLSEKGIFVWTSSLSGDKGNYEYTDVENLFQPVVVGAYNDEKLVSIYERSNYYNNNKTEDIVLDSTWFNYSYVTLDFERLLSNSSNVNNYLDVIYTGDGLAELSNTDLDNENPNYHNGMKDMPYRIKHPGILDSIVIENSKLETPQYRYYSVEADLDFSKYEEEIYWSETWDKIGAYFYGDFNGNGRTIKNMYSSYGLLRAIPEVNDINSAIDNVKDHVTDPSRVYDIVFENCYSKTGLVAGYLGGSNDQDDDKKNSIYYINTKNKANYVYNGNLSEVSADNKKFYFPSESGELASETDEKNIAFFNPASSLTYVIASKNAYTVTAGGKNAGYYGTSTTPFAGGLVGVMTGGKIENIGVKNDKTPGKYNDVNILIHGYEREVSYAGGLVGVMLGGVIGGESKDKLMTFGGVNLYSYIDIDDPDKLTHNSTDTCLTYDDFYKETLAYNNSVHVVSQPYSYLGGVVGYLGGKAQLQYIDINTKTVNSANGVQPVMNGMKMYGLYAMGGLAGMVNVEFGSDLAPAILGCSVTEIDMSIATAVMPKPAKDGGKTNGVTNLQADGQITEFIVADDLFMGGIVAHLTNGVISDCSYKYKGEPTVTFNGLWGEYKAFLGGIVGYMNDTNKDIPTKVMNCELSSDAVLYLDANQYSVVGGIVAYLDGGTISGCGANDNSNILSIYTPRLTTQKQYVSDKAVKVVYNGVETNEWNDEYSAQDFLNGKPYGNGGSAGFTFGLSIKGYAVGGGIVGRLSRGDVLSSENHAKVISLSNAGGIAGEVINTSGKSNITDCHNYGVVQGVGILNGEFTVHLNVEGQVSTSNEQNYKELEDAYSGGNMYNFLTNGLNASQNTANNNLIVDLTTILVGFLKCSISLGTSSSGGIAGYVYCNRAGVKTSNNITYHVRIEDCSSDEYCNIGYFTSMFVGGIAGVVEGHSDSTYSSILIKNCHSASALKAYSICSFAGGIVGYLAYGTTLEDCYYHGHYLGYFSDLFVKSQYDWTSKEFWKEAFGTLLNTFAIPYIMGGVVGYMQDGHIVNCNTGKLTSISNFGEDFKTWASIVLGFRVAGGLVGVMRGGVFEAAVTENNPLGIIYNTAIVLCPTGVAGGAFGVLNGGHMVTAGGKTSIYENLFNLLDTYTQKKSQDDSTSFFGVMFDLIKQFFQGYIVNMFTGIVMGYVSGGVVGLYNQGGNQGSNQNILSGLINLGTTTNSFSLILALMGLVTAKVEEGDNAKSYALTTFIKNISNVEDAGNKVESKVEDAINSVRNWIEKFQKFISGNITAGFTVNGNKYALVKLGGSLNMTPSLGNATLDLGVNLGTGPHSLTEYLSEWWLDDYSFSNLQLNIADKSHSLRMSDFVTNEEKNIKNDKVDDEKARNSFGDGDEADKKAELLVRELGQGVSGGIVGLITGRNAVKLNLNLNLSFAINFTELINKIKSNHQKDGDGPSAIDYMQGGTDKSGDAQNDLNFFTGVTASTGTAGGIVGAALGNTVVTCSWNVQLALGDTPSVFGAYNAGGIIGYAGKGVQIITIPHEGEMALIVLNTGNIYSFGNAGGIIGWAHGASISNQDIDDFFRRLDIGAFATINGVTHETTLFSTPILKYFAKLCIFNTVNTGNVHSGKTAGGLVGLLDDAGTNDASFIGQAIVVGHLLSISGNSITACDSAGGAVGHIVGDCHLADTIRIGTDSTIGDWGKIKIEAHRETGNAGGLFGWCEGVVEIGRCVKIRDAKPTDTIQYEVDNVIIKSGVVVGDGKYVGGVGGYVHEVRNSELPTGYGDEKASYCFVDITSEVKLSKVGAGGFFGEVAANADGSHPFVFSMALDIDNKAKMGGEHEGSDDLQGILSSALQKKITTKLVVDTASVIYAIENLKDDPDASGESGGEGGNTEFKDLIYVGGVVAKMKNGTIRNVDVTATIEINLEGEAADVLKNVIFVGGVVGKMTGGLIENVTISAPEAKETSQTGGEPTSSWSATGTPISGAPSDPNANEPDSNSSHALISGSALAVGGVAGYMTGGQIKSAKVVNSYITGATFAGGIVGAMAKGAIIGTANEGETTGYELIGASVYNATYAGGIAGAITRFEINVTDHDFTNDSFKDILKNGAIAQDKKIVKSLVGIDLPGGLTLNKDVTVNFNLLSMGGSIDLSVLNAENRTKAISNLGESPDGEYSYVAGGVVGLMNGGYVSNVEVTNTTSVQAQSFAGGIVGEMNSGTLVSGITFNGTVESVGFKDSYDEEIASGIKEENFLYAVGGLVGKLGALKNSLGDPTTGGTIGGNSIKVDKDAQIISATKYEYTDKDEHKQVIDVPTALGGLVGIMSSLILKEKNNELSNLAGASVDGSLNSENVKFSTTAHDYTYIGGMVGVITNGLVGAGTGVDNLKGNKIGGVAGLMTGGKITGNTNPADVIATGNDAYAGGFVGIMTGGTISGSDMYANTVKAENATGASLGGMVGYIYTGNPTLSGGYGANVEGGTYSGGVVGKIAPKEIDGELTTPQVTIPGDASEVPTAGKVSGAEYAGGFAGYLEANTTNNDELKKTELGGIVTLPARPSDSNKTSVQGSKAAGGLVGLAISGVISGAVSSRLTTADLSGKFEVQSGTSAGGLIGQVGDGSEDSTQIVFMNSVGGTDLAVSGTTNAGGIIGLISQNAVVQVTNDNHQYSSGEKEIKSQTVGGYVGRIKGSMFGDVHDNPTKYFSIFHGKTLQVEGNGGTIGGIAGYVESTGSIAFFTYNSGFSVDNNTTMGGIAGTNEGLVYACTTSDLRTIHDKTSSTTDKNSPIGGTVGLLKNGGIVANCVNSGTILVNRQYIGGIVGKTEKTGSDRGIITNCINSGIVASTTGKSVVGGIVGLLNGADVYGCSSSGRVALSAEEYTNSVKEGSTALSDKIETEASNGFTDINSWLQVGVDHISHPSGDQNKTAFQSGGNYSGSVGGLVGQVYGNSGATYVGGTPSADVYGFYYYGADSHDEATSLKRGDEVTKAYTDDTAIDRRGTLVGSNLLTEKSQLTLSASSTAVSYGTDKTRTVTWAEINEDYKTASGEAIEEEAYYFGVTVTHNTNESAGSEETGYDWVSLDFSLKKGTALVTAETTSYRYHTFVKLESNDTKVYSQTSGDYDVGAAMTYYLNAENKPNLYNKDGHGSYTENPDGRRFKGTGTTGNSDMDAFVDFTDNAIETSKKTHETVRVTDNTSKPTAITSRNINKLVVHSGKLVTTYTEKYVDSAQNELPVCGGDGDRKLSSNLVNKYKYYTARGVRSILLYELYHSNAGQGDKPYTFNNDSLSNAWKKLGYNELPTN